jgi:hypothetical protein
MGRRTVGPVMTIRDIEFFGMLIVGMAGIVVLAVIAWFMAGPQTSMRMQPQPSPPPRPSRDRSTQCAVIERARLAEIECSSA